MCSFIRKALAIAMHIVALLLAFVAVRSQNYDIYLMALFIEMFYWTLLHRRLNVPCPHDQKNDPPRFRRPGR